MKKKNEILPQMNRKSEKREKTHKTQHIHKEKKTYK